MSTLLANAISYAFNQNGVFQNFLEAFQKNRFPLDVHGIHGSSLALFIQALHKKSTGPLFVVIPGELEAETLASDLMTLGVEPKVFPWWGTLFYQGISAQASIFGQRARVLATLLSHPYEIVILPLKSFLFPVPPPAIFRASLMTFQKGNLINTTKTSERLTQLGYLRVPHVSVAGEFALRGEVLDIFLHGTNEAVRLISEYQTIIEIKFFDPLLHSTIKTVNEVTIYPVREVVWTSERIQSVNRHSCWGEGWLELQEELERSGTIRGVELFYPFIDSSRSFLADYVNSAGCFLFSEWDRLLTLQESLKKEWVELYNRAKEQGLTAPSPQEVFFDFDPLVHSLDRKVIFHNLRKKNSSLSHHYQFDCDQYRSFYGNITSFKEEMQTLLAQGWNIFVLAQSPSQAQRIHFLLKDLNITVIPYAISSGFSLPEQKLLCISENEIFGRRKRSTGSLNKVQSQVIESFVELSPGDFVVHINYGIGQFQGIDRIKAGRNERDYIKVIYASEETIFLPIEQINLIQRYIGSEGKSPRLDVLGGKTWENKKNKAKKSVEDLANQLIALYANRKSVQGFSFPKDNDWQISFEAAFPWQETDDQSQASQEIKADMENPRPMDRLLCGDVGYGKTEVAMRACFKAVVGGKQVAFLAPTTILVEQLYENFVERFERFPVRIAMLSRFVSKADQKKILYQIALGEVDIVIGTHRLLQKDVEFKNLGFIVIDEEQRFGVKDKEKLKELKATVDCLAMSATPIPRTLHMSLLKIRDMSVLRTAPLNRQPIETFIQEFSDEVVMSSIRREIERGGQVFFLHNHIETLENIQIYLQRLLPELSIHKAHGQMDPQSLEQVMYDFAHGHFHVLVSTTIIENGIDIPNVNTIIIDRADMYGISQLYQLRGRVGRSGKVAYAYLLYPEGRVLSELSMKRLQVISDFTELGAGFKIAMKDLEVRGAGNLLGIQQSGDIISVGFEMYLKLLDEAVNEKMNEEKDQAEEVYLELDYSGFIPDEYVQDPTDKMNIYKKIASVTDEQDLDRVHQEIFNQFGAPPDEVESLLSLAEVHIICRQLKIRSLREHDGICIVEFGKMSNFPFDKAMRLLATSAGKVKSLPHKPNALILETKFVSLQEKSAFIREKLSLLL